MKNLETFNEGFPLEGSIICDLDDVVELTEDAETLRLLLLFSHNSSYPDLSKLNIDVVLALGDAAEKYGNHLAFMACSQALGCVSQLDLPFTTTNLPDWIDISLDIHPNML
jgi:hypothetical protein